MSNRYVMAVLVVASLTVTQVCFAGGGRNNKGGAAGAHNKAGHAAQANRQDKHDDQNASGWVVSSVDASAGTLSVQGGDGKEAKVYKVTSFTTVTINGQSGKLADIATGMKVTFIVGVDGSTLSTLTATGGKSAAGDRQNNAGKKKH